MTDELGIQKQQKQGNYAVPGMLSGAVIGAAGGAYAAHKGYGFNVTKPNLDEVFAQAPDTFKRQIEKGGENKGAWETAQNWVDRINNEYDQKVADITRENTIPNDPELAKKVATAQTEYDAALSAEKARLARENGAGGEFKPKPYGELTTTPAIPEGKTANEVMTEYNNLYTRYESARAGLSSDAKYVAQEAKVQKFERALNDIFTIGDNTVNNGIKKGSKLPEAEVIERVFAKEQTPTIKKWLKSVFGVSPTVYDQILAKVEKDILPLPTVLTESQIRGLGEYVEQTKPSEIKKVQSALKATEEIHIINDAKGKPKGYVIAPKGTAAEALKDAKAATKEQQAVVAEELLGNAKKHAELSRQMKGIPSEIVESQKKILENAKLTTDASLVEAEIQALDPKQMEKDLKAIRKVGSSTNPAVEQAIANSYTVGSETSITFDEAKRRIEARLSVRNTYDTKVKGIQDELTALVENDSRLSEAKSQLERIAGRNKDVAKARKALQKAFPDLFPKGAGVTMTEDEIAAKAAEAIKDKRVALDDLIKAAEEKGSELSAKGKKLIEDLGSKDAYQKDLKEKAAKELEPLLSKFKLPSKTWTGVAAAVVLGLCGLGIGAAARKDS